MLDQIAKTIQLAKGSKWTRFVHQPGPYLFAFLFRKMVYPFTKKEVLVKKTLFFGQEMMIALPASTDIYLTGGKSHDSELRLARFLINTLAPDSNFLDIGAHYGYFTLLAANIITGKGSITSFEPATASYQLLEKNTANLNNVIIYHEAVSDSDDDLIFFEFPNAQSEYNTSDLAQFQKAKWYDPSTVVKKNIKATTIDLIVSKGLVVPDVIKIDVEGAEYKVLSGGKDFFIKSSPFVIMEYLHPNRSNDNHVKAVLSMKELGYQTFVIDQAGSLVPIEDIDRYLLDHTLESDNVVFKKRG